MLKQIVFLTLAAMSLPPVAVCRASGLAAEQAAQSIDVTTRTVDIRKPFNSVSASSIFNVEITQGPAKVQITSSSEAIAATKFDVRGGILSISLTDNSIKRKDFPNIQVNISMPDIRSLSGSGASCFTIKGKIEVGKLDLDGSGACNFRFDDIKCTDFEVELTGASSFDCPLMDCSECDLDASGGTSAGIGRILCTELNIDASGGSNIKVGKVKCDNIEADASGGSSIKIGAIDAGTVECDASGAAHITVEGKCKKADLEASGASKISASGLQCGNVSVSKSGVANIRR